MKCIPILANLRRKYILTGLLVATVICFCFQYLFTNDGDYYRYLLRHVTYNFSNRPEGLFLVSSPSCKIPDVHPLDKSLWDLLEPPVMINCSTKTALSSVMPIDESRTRFKLVINTHPKVIEQYVSDYTDLKCCYSIITRITTPRGQKYDKTADDKCRIDDCLYFDITEEQNLPEETEFLAVYCYNVVSLKVYSNIHAVVPIKKSVSKQMKKCTTGKGDSCLSFLLVGIDGTSRLNFMRSMRKTMTHIKKNNWFELHGFTKVGLNTFPNLLAVLAGSKESLEVCSPYHKKVYDDCPLLWKFYKQKGYITAYGEDEPDVSTFNYLKIGFVLPPTDYYLRPFMLAGYKHFGYKYRDSQTVCMGATDITSHMLQYAVDFVTVFKDYATFALFWFNNFSHNNHNTVASNDEHFFNFLQTLEENEIFNSTAVIFFSDHGMRFGNIMRKEVGKLEDKLPFIYIWLPKWFQNKYPILIENLNRNKAKLVSGFDLHKTMADYLQTHLMGQVDDSEEYINNSCTNSVSLFANVPHNRSCDDACIKPEYCPCTTYEVLEQGSIEGFRAANTAVEHLSVIIKDANDILGKSSSTRCASLTLSKVTKAKKKIQHDKSTNIKDYLVEFETIPGNALYEGIVRINEGIKESSVIGILNRINEYGDQSSCINDTLLKNYCYCIKNTWLD